MEHIHDIEGLDATIVSAYTKEKYIGIVLAAALNSKDIEPKDVHELYLGMARGLYEDHPVSVAA